MPPSLGIAIILAILGSGCIFSDTADSTRGNEKFDSSSVPCKDIHFTYSNFTADNYKNRPIAIQYGETGILFSDPLQNKVSVQIPGDRISADFIRFELYGREYLCRTDSSLHCYPKLPFSDSLYRDSDCPGFTYRTQKIPEEGEYPQRELSFYSTQNGDSIKLSGSLTIPRGDGPFPVILLVAGSGPQTRAGRYLGHDFFGVLSAELLHNGIATFRYDERGVGESEGKYYEAVTEDLALDAASALTLLEGLSVIDKRSVGVIGHSEGAMIAGMLAANNQCDFTIMLGAPAAPTPELFADQVARSLRLEGLPETLVSKDSAYRHEFLSLINRESDEEKIKTEAKKLTESFYRSLDSTEMENYPSEDGLLITSLASFTTPWFKNFVRFEHEKYLSRVEIPTLVVYGGKDFQVSERSNRPYMEKYLAQNPHPFTNINSYPELNHLMQISETGSMKEYAFIPETIAPKLLQDIRAWINGCLESEN